MLASAVVAGVLLGAATGDIRNLKRLEIRGAPLLVFAALLRALGLLVLLPPPVHVATFAAFAGVAFINRHLPGALAIFAGIALNLVVIAVNGGMPVSPHAAELAGFELRSDGLHIVLGPMTHLSVFADVIPVPLVRNVYSVGDFVLAAGGFWLPFKALRSR